jgi:shikimate kinase
MPQLRSLQLDKIIALVGLMGCGKTSIGKCLAKELDIPFIDLDNQIENMANMSIPEIFENRGEAYFRQLEIKEAKKILDGKPLVLATGGGAFINDEIRALIKEKAISIWINADLETLLERVSRKNTRPLLETGNKKEILQHLIDKRYPIYKQADITVNTSKYSHNVVLGRIIEAINDKF